MRMFHLLLIILIGLTVNVKADIYYYVDENGVWHFTNIKTEPHYRLYLKTVNKMADQYIKDYEKVIIKAAKKFGVEAPLIKAIIKAESDFDQKAISVSGAKGLMQLMPQTAMEMNVSDPLDPRENIFGGTRYLSILLRHFGDISLAVAAYNAGPKNVEYFEGIPPFPETRAFVKRVLRYYRIYKKQR